MKTIPGPGCIDPTEVAKNLYAFCNEKLSVRNPLSDVLYWKDHDGILHFAICGRSGSIFLAFEGFEGVWDNSAGRLDLALASALGVPRQISERLVSRDGLSVRREYPMDRGQYTRLIRKWIQRATQESEIELHLMPDAHRRPDGLLAYSGRAGRMVAAPGGRTVDHLPLDKSILALEMPADDRAWAKREGDAPLFTMAPIGDLLPTVRELRALPPVVLEYGFDISLMSNVYALLDPWLVQSRYEPPQPTAPGAWPVTLWSEAVTVDSPPSYRDLIRAQRDGRIDAAEVPWIYTAGLPRPRALHPEWEGLHRAIHALRKKYDAGERAIVSGFCNAFLDLSAVRAVLCRPGSTSSVHSALSAAGWRGTIIEFGGDDRTWRRRIIREIERLFEPACFSEPVDPKKAKPRTVGKYQPLPWRKSDFGI